jgi:hypothetical protein
MEEIKKLRILANYLKSKGVDVVELIEVEEGDVCVLLNDHILFSMRLTVSKYFPMKVHYYAAWDMFESIEFSDRSNHAKNHYEIS